MQRLEADILISGGGVAGLTAASAFGSAGYSVICTDPTPPVTNGVADGADLRSTAFLQPSLQVLEKAGLWQRLLPHAAALQVMRIIDAGGQTPEPRLTKDFVAAELSELPFGWNIPNWLLRREMVARLAELPNVRFLPGISTTALMTRSSEALVTLSDRTQAAVRLVIAADGRNSTMREAAGISVKAIHYGQKALAFTVTHLIPHANISTEIHRSGGPFTLVPLPDRDGMPSSAVVWMERGPEADRLSTLPVGEFEAAMNERSCHILGPLTLQTKRSLWPMISQIAGRMYGERLALMAEAAHVVPPIGAQGLNMSLADLTTMLDLAANHELGSESMLTAYQRSRHLEIKARVAGIDALNRASMLENPTLRNLRAGALNALYSLAPVRKTLMKAGLGLR